MWLNSLVYSSSPDSYLVRDFNLEIDVMVNLKLILVVFEIHHDRFLVSCYPEFIDYVELHEFVVIDQGERKLLFFALEKPCSDVDEGNLFFCLLGNYKPVLLVVYDLEALYAVAPAVVFPDGLLVAKGFEDPVVVHVELQDLADDEAFFVFDYKHCVELSRRELYFHDFLLIELLLKDNLLHSVHLPDFYPTALIADREVAPVVVVNVQVADLASLLYVIHTCVLTLHLLEQVITDELALFNHDDFLRSNKTETVIPEVLLVKLDSITPSDVLGAN